MGRLTCDPIIHHFSHPHPLHLSSLNQHQHSLTPLPCLACTLPITSTEWTYSCKSCNFHLHMSCSQLPPIITHPSHSHPLSLFPVPAYPEGFFNCDACGHDGRGFSYHCTTCGVDFHTTCVSMPLSVSHHAHRHPLSIAFFPPYDNKGFSCDICGSLGGNHWLYRCAACEFDVHLGCTTRPGLVNGGGSGGGSSRRGWQQGISGAGSSGNGLMRQAIEGLVSGAAGQIGQTLVQGFMGGGGATNESESGGEGGSNGG